MKRANPVDRIKDDELGLSELAIHLATTLDGLESELGYVIGISGGWGTGKTSLLNMVFDHREIKHSRKDAVISISPWTIPPRDNVVAFFLSEFARQLREYAAEHGAKAEGAMSEIRTASDKIGYFADRLRPISKIARVAGKVGVPGGEIVADAIDSFANDGESASFAKLKDRVSDALQMIDRPVFVILDDLDRVEPKRVSEILTTVRAIADFPNIVYLLLYEKNKISKSIKTSLKYDDGEDFLEKIVQFEIMMPSPESFSLRRMFRKRLSMRLQEIDFEVSIEENELLGSIIEQWGSRYLTNPRRVEQAIDHIIFLVTNPGKNLFLPDAIFISILKIGSRKYYEWVEKYLITFSSLTIGRAFLTDNSSQKMFDEFCALLEGEQLDLSYELVVIDDIIPGISPRAMTGDSNQVLFNRSILIPRAGELKRLGSPDHYRLYFASAFAADAPDERMISSLVSSMSSQEELSTVLKAAFDDGKVRQIEVALDRLAKDRRGLVPEGGGASLLKALTVVGDHPEVTSRIDGLFREPVLWPEAKALLEVSKPSELSPNELEAIFYENPALGWMTSLLRSETFSHGRFGSQETSERDWALSEKQLDAALRGYDRKLRSSALGDLLGVVVFSHILFAWVQGGYGENAREFIRKKTRRNLDFLAFLEAFDTGGSGDHRVIRRDGSSDLFDFDAYVARLQKLAKDPKFSKRATEILEKFGVRA